MKKYSRWALTIGLTGALLASTGQATEAATFTDVPESAQHYAAVEKLVALGALHTGSGKFNPQNDITRGQASKILAIAFKLPLPTLTTSRFADVKTTDEFAPYIHALSDAGIINGYEDKTFKPNGKLTRGQMAKILSNIVELKTTAELTYTFKDVPLENGYAPYVQALYHAGITTGREDGTFGVNERVKRSHFALFIDRSLAYMDGEDIYPFFIKTTDYLYNEATGDYDEVHYTKVEFERVSDGKVLTVPSNTDEFTLPDFELYVAKYYTNNQLQTTELVKKSNSSYERGHLHYFQESTLVNGVNAIVIDDFTGSGEGDVISQKHETYTVVEGDASAVTFSDERNASGNTYVRTVITKPGGYFIRSTSTKGYSLEGYIEVVEYDGKLYAHVPVFGR